jgi:type IV fimbrial biogenesis protein FimT
MMVLLMVGVLASLALPPITEWIAVSRLRAAAEGMQHAVRLAQAEALRRSRSTALVLTQATPAIGATPASDGQRWWVQSLMRSGESASDQRMLQNGTDPASMNVSVSGVAVLCFNALGQQVTLTGTANGLGVNCTAPSTATTYTEYTFTHIRTSRRMRIQVGKGGEVRMCNPDKTLSDEAPDGCR